MKTVTKLLLLTFAVSQALTLVALKNDLLELAKEEVPAQIDDLLQREIDEYHTQISQELKAQEDRNAA